MENTIVIDNGSFMTKAGFAGDDSPLAIFPTIVGKPRHIGIMIGMGSRDRYVGDESQSKCGILTITHPVRKGIITDWDDMQAIWHHTFYNELRRDPTEYFVLLTEPPLNRQMSRLVSTEIMFEVFNIQGLSIQNTGILSLYSAEKTHGTVILVGGDISYIVPISRDFVTLYDAVSRIDLAGNDLTLYLQILLNQRGYSFNTTAEREIVRDIKEKLCCVSLDYQSDLKSFLNSTVFDKEYELPDGQIITIGNEVFKCPELLFRPDFPFIDCDSIQDSTYNSYMKCDQQIRNDLFSDIVLSGGSTMFPQFTDRLNKELNSLLNLKEMNILKHPQRDNLSWIGGSIFASLVDSEKKFVLKQEYEENGSFIIERIR
ncbi:actin-10-related [Anaeramoeba ignava]|uniref:Actin-10-related n=1 Tax=Anaeramoeba ignava TaxID=1746090 RepID=A0A9Q0LAL2_ANAIG|nr:actin-10-related [Anaeramoeba ignava]